MPAVVTAEGQEGARNSRRRLVAHACAVTAAAWSIFWFVQQTSGPFHDRLLRPLLSAVFFGAAAVGFVLVARGRRLSVWAWLPMLPMCGALALEEADRVHKVMAVASFATVVAFIVVGVVLDRRPRH